MPIVPGALIGIAQDIVGLLDETESLGGLLGVVGILVGMPLECLFPCAQRGRDHRDGEVGTQRGRGERYRRE